MLSSWQVTIVTDSVPAVGGESGETRCQGDMEKADMVDGKKRLGSVLLTAVVRRHVVPVVRPFDSLGNIS